MARALITLTRSYLLSMTSCPSDVYTDVMENETQPTWQSSAHRTCNGGPKIYFPFVKENAEHTTTAMSDSPPPPVYQTGWRSKAPSIRCHKDDVRVSSEPCARRVYCAQPAGKSAWEQAVAAGTEGDYVILTDGVKRQNPRAGAEGQPYSADYSTIVQMETGKTRLTGEGRVSQMCDASHAIHDAGMPGAIACMQGENKAWLPGGQAPENTCDNHAGHSGVEVRTFGPP